MQKKESKVPLHWSRDSSIKSHGYMEKAVLPFEEQISLEQWKREGEEFTNHEVCYQYIQ